MKCVEDGCDNEALKDSNYCAKHRPMTMKSVAFKDMRQWNRRILYKRDSAWDLRTPGPDDEGIKDVLKKIKGEELSKFLSQFLDELDGGDAAPDAHMLKELLKDLKGKKLQPFLREFLNELSDDRLR